MSVCGENRGLMERVRVNRQILENPYWKWAVAKGSPANFVPVGRGQKTGSMCGKWSHFSVCDNVEGHKGVFVKGVDYTDKQVVMHHHRWCNRSSCCVCFVRGWAIRLARSVTGRLTVGSEELGLGKIEHTVISIPRTERWLDESVLRVKCRNAFFDRGGTGGMMLWHGYRMDKSTHTLVWSPHYHCLGFIEGGFDHCRDCSHVYGDCDTCSGFKGREVRGFAKDGYLVSVKGERETIFGSAFYLLHHATIRVGVKRFHVVTWFGVCGNRKFSGRKPKVAVGVCPACHSDMKRKVYVGSARIVRDIGNPWYRPLFLMDVLDGSGKPNFVDVGDPRAGGSSGGG